MFASLRSKFKSLRRGGDDDARIQRKARSAAKSINKTAAQDLLEWEDRNGYKTTRSHEAFTSGSSSGSATQTNRDRTISTTKQSSQLASVPFVTSPTLDQETPGLTESLDVFAAQQPPALPRPASVFELRPDHNQPSPEERQRRITLQMEVEEKERLLKEIQDLRQSITHLKTNDINQLAPLNTTDLGGSARLSPTTPSAVRRSAPWLSKDRSSRPQSLYTSSPASESPNVQAPPVRSDAYQSRASTDRNRRKSVAEIFAQDSPRPLAPPIRPAMSHRGSSGNAAPQLPMPKDITAPSAPASGSGSASAGTKTPPDDAGSQHHRRSTSSSGPAAAAAAAAAARPRSQLRDVPPVPQIKRDANGAPIVTSKPSSTSVPPQARAGKSRQIIDTPEDAQKRYSAALGRSRSPAGPQNPKRRSTMGPEEVRGAREPSNGGGMTLAELQERHLAKLRQMQSPTSEKLLQEQALSLAKAEWERRTRVERQEQQRKRAEAEEKIRRNTAARPSLSLNGKERRRTLSEDVLNSYHNENQAEVPPSPDAPPSPKMTAKRMSGAQKAREWRQSLASLSEETRIRALQQQQDGSGQATNEFGRVRNRAQSSLGLTRPAAQPSVPSPQVPQLQYGYQQQSMGYFPSTYPSPGPPSQLQPQPQPQGMSRSSSHSPSATTAVGEMSRSNSYFAGAGSTVQPSPSFSHKRQLTATDLRRLREGAGPGRRPVSMALSHEASRLPQRVG